MERQRYLGATREDLASHLPWGQGGAGVRGRMQRAGTLGTPAQFLYLRSVIPGPASSSEQPQPQSRLAARGGSRPALPDHGAP